MMDDCDECKVELDTIFKDMKPNNERMISILYSIAKIIIENYDENIYNEEYIKNEEDEKFQTN